VPDVRRAKVADATAVLQGLGLSVILELQPGADATLQLYVVDQLPASTTVVNSGSTVTLKVVNVLP
jgi:beta-lactam-binding protein with PASTA domain